MQGLPIKAAMSNLRASSSVKSLPLQLVFCFPFNVLVNHLLHLYFCKDKGSQQDTAKDKHEEQRGYVLPSSEVV
jgi:hypothetical protein